MTYLLDSDVFIRAKNNHYRFAVCPGFWEWLTEANHLGIVYSLTQVLEEISQVGKVEPEPNLDELALWAQQQGAAFFIQPSSESERVYQQIADLVNRNDQYRQRARDHFLAKADPWLIAHAHSMNWIVVTHEVSAPDSQRSVKIPDICSALEPRVRCISPFEMLQREGAVFDLRSSP